MKKFLAILAIAGTLVACNNSTETTTTPDTTVVAPTVVTPDTTVVTPTVVTPDTTTKMADTTHK